MAFCLCLVVIITIFSAVQGRSGPINGTREALNSPCQSIYSFQKLNFETLKNSLNEGDNDQVFTGLAYDSLSGRVFLSSPKVSGRQVAVSYFRIEDYTPGSQPRLMPFPYFESGSSSCDEEKTQDVPKSIDDGFEDNSKELYEIAGVQKLVASGRKLLGLSTRGDGNEEEEDATDEDQVEAVRDSRSLLAGGNRIGRTRHRNDDRNGDQDEVVFVDLDNDRNRVPERPHVYNYNRIISRPQINYDSEERWPISQIVNTGSIGGGNYRGHGSRGRQRNRKHGGQDQSVVVVNADTSDWNLGQHYSDRIRGNGGSGGYVVVNGDNDDNRWSSTVIDTDQLSQTSVAGGIGQHLFSTGLQGTHGNRLNRVRERGHKRRRNGGQDENIIVVLKGDRHQHFEDNDDQFYEHDHYHGLGHSSSYGFGGHGSQGYYLGSRLGRSAFSSSVVETDDKLKERDTDIDPKPVQVDEPLATTEESLNISKPSEELSTDDSVVEFTEGPVSAVGRKLLSFSEDDVGDEDESERDLPTDSVKAPGVFRSARQWNGENTRPQTAYDRLLARLLRRTQKNTNNSNRKKIDQERETPAVGGFGNGYYIVRNKPSPTELANPLPVSGYLQPGGGTNKPWPVRVIQIDAADFNRGNYYDRNRLNGGHSSGYRWSSSNRYKHDRYPVDRERYTKPDRFSGSGSVEQPQPDRKRDRFSDSEELGRSLGGGRESHEYDGENHNDESDEYKLAGLRQNNEEDIESRNFNGEGDNEDDPLIENIERGYSDKVFVVDLTSASPRSGYVVVKGRSFSDSNEGWSSHEIESDRGRLRRVRDRRVRRTRGRKRAQEQQIVVMVDEDDQAKDNYYSPGGYNYNHRFDRDQRSSSANDYGSNEGGRLYAKRWGRSEMVASPIHNNSTPLSTKDSASENVKDLEVEKKESRPGRKLLSVSEEEEEEDTHQNSHQSQQRPNPHVSVYAIRVDTCRRLWVLDTGVDESGFSQEHCTDPSISVFDISSSETKQIQKSRVPKDLFHNATGFQNIVVYSSTCEDAVAFIVNTVDKTILEYTFSTGMFNVILNIDDTTRLDSAIRNVAENGQWPHSDWIAEASTNEKVKPSKKNEETVQKSQEYPLLSPTSALGTFKNFVFFGDSKTNSIKCMRKQKGSMKAQISTVFQDKDHLNHLHAMATDDKENVYILSNEWPLLVSGQKKPSDMSYSIVRCNMKLLIEGSVCDDSSPNLGSPLNRLSNF